MSCVSQCYYISKVIGRVKADFFIALIVLSNFFFVDNRFENITEMPIHFFTIHELVTCSRYILQTTRAVCVPGKRNQINPPLFTTLTTTKELIIFTFIIVNCLKRTLVGGGGWGQLRKQICMTIKNVWQSIWKVLSSFYRKHFVIITTEIYRVHQNINSLGFYRRVFLKPYCLLCYSLNLWSI